MKKLVKSCCSRFRVAVAVATLAVLAGPGCAPMYASNPPGYTQVGASVRYSDLDGWGSWQVHAQFGDVWYPNVAADWAPFTYGNWVWTDHGWLWSSYEPYGWLVFHYGNWYYDDVSGWFWVPGTAWSAAPVNWCVYDDYISWAPIPPRGVMWQSPWEAGMSVVWTSVPQRDFLQENVGRHRVTPQRPLNIGSRGVVRRSPDVKYLTDDNQGRPRALMLNREKVTFENRTYYKSKLPGPEREKVSRYQGRFTPGPKRTHLREAGVTEQARDKKGHGRPPY